MRAQGIGAKGIYGSIYVAEGDTAQSVQTATAEVIEAFNTGDGANGNANGVTPVKTSNKITIDHAGEYKVGFQCAFIGGSNVTWGVHAYFDGVLQPQLGTHRKTPTNDVGSMSFVGTLTGVAAKDLDVRVEHDGGGDVDFTPIDVQLVVERLDKSG